MTEFRKGYNQSSSDDSADNRSLMSTDSYFDEDDQALGNNDNGKV